MGHRGREEGRERVCQQRRRRMVLLAARAGGHCLPLAPPARSGPRLPRDQRNGFVFVTATIKGIRDRGADGAGGGATLARVWCSWGSDLLPGGQSSQIPNFWPADLSPLWSTREVLHIYGRFSWHGFALGVLLFLGTKGLIRNAKCVQAALWFVGSESVPRIDVGIGSTAGRPLRAKKKRVPYRGVHQGPN